jgi:hypothetical protein
LPSARVAYVTRRARAAERIATEAKIPLFYVRKLKKKILRAGSGFFRVCVRGGGGSTRARRRAAARNPARGPCAGRAGRGTQRGAVDFYRIFT